MYYNIHFFTLYRQLLICERKFIKMGSEKILINYKVEFILIHNLP